MKRIGEIQMATAAKAGNLLTAALAAAHLAGAPTAMALPLAPPAALLELGALWLACRGGRRLWRRLGPARPLAEPL